MCERKEWTAEGLKARDEGRGTRDAGIGFVLGLFFWGRKKDILA